MSETETKNVSPPEVDTAEAHELTNGRVKWFNNKAGYGFITVTNGEYSGTDVFVHHSVIQVANEQYRYLVQGEYVNFKMCALDDKESGHKWQAGEVKGNDGGKLMCETRNESRQERLNYKNEDGTTNRPRRQRESVAPPVRIRGQGPRDGDEWMLVRRRNPRNAVTSPNKREPVRSRSNNNNRQM